MDADDGRSVSGTHHADDADASFEKKLDELNDELEKTQFSYTDRFWMTESTTAEDLKEWVDSLGLRSMDLHVRRFVDFSPPTYYHGADDHDGVIAMFVDSTPRGIGYWPFPWCPGGARRWERDRMAEPSLSVSFNLDDPAHPAVEERAQSPYVDRVFRLRDLVHAHALADSGDREEMLSPDVFALCDDLSGFVLPVTSHSTILWRSFADGAENRIEVTDGDGLRSTMRQYPQYYGLAPCDEGAARTHIKSLENVLGRIVDEGLDPSTVWPLRS